MGEGRKEVRRTETDIKIGRRSVGQGGRDEDQCQPVKVPESRQPRLTRTADKNRKSSGEEESREETNVFCLLQGEIERTREKKRMKVKMEERPATGTEIDAGAGQRSYEVKFVTTEERSLGKRNGPTWTVSE